MIEERERFEVLLEDVQTSVKVIAEGHSALVEHLGQMNSRFDRLETRFDGLELRFDRLETRFDGLETRVSGLEVFASDAQQRLKRIEGHFELNGSKGSKGSSRSNPRRTATRDAPPKRRKKA
jgi:hypothetical protein